MRAIVYRRYGGPEVLQLEERPTPTPGPGQVLVRVRATSINAADHRLMRANPFLVRLVNGLRRPTKRVVLGQDFAGVVVAAGPGVTAFAVGDAVFGESPMDRDGAFAECVVAESTALVKMPAGVEFEQAAAVPLAGVTAVQAMRSAGVGPGTRLLIVGAGGGVGLFAVQVARALGAQVSAVCGPGSVDLVRGLGGEDVIDYSREDFTARGAAWDAIVAVNGNASILDFRRSLRRGGRYVLVGGGGRQLFQSLLFARPLFAFQGKSGRVLTIDGARQQADLAQLAAWCASGTVRVVIDRRYALAEAAEAMTYVEQGHVKGKVVLHP